MNVETKLNIRHWHVSLSLTRDTYTNTCHCYYTLHCYCHMAWC